MTEITAPKSAVTAEQFADEIREQLKYTQGVTVEQAKPADVYVAASAAARRHLVDSWMKTQADMVNGNTKAVGYLSAEFLMGKQLENALLNAGLTDQFNKAVKDLGFSAQEIIDAEYEPGLGNGGLGRLAACFIDSLASLGVPAFGYGIQYKYGIFKQEFDENGKQIEILTEDEQGDATQAVNCFTKMVDEGMTALIGDVTTTPTLAVVAESADYNMPMVTASATAEAVTYDAETDTVNANVFRATFTDPFQGIKMADYAYQKLGYTKAAVIFKKGADYNEGLAENFVNEFESLGGTIVDQESYSEGDVDFKTQLTTILGKDPETVFCPNYYEEVGQILSQAESVGLTVPFLGGDGWDGLEGYASNDQLKDTYFCANYAKGSNAEFEDAYKAEYGEEYPNGFSPLGYDAAKTVVYGLQAAEDAGLEAGTDDYKQAVIDAIASGTIDGITGTFTFDEHHDPVKQTAILTYVDGKPVLKEMF